MVWKGACVRSFCARLAKPTIALIILSSATMVCVVTLAIHSILQASTHTDPVEEFVSIPGLIDWAEKQFSTSAPASSRLVVFFTNIYPCCAHKSLFAPRGRGTGLKSQMLLVLHPSFKPHDLANLLARWDPPCRMIIAPSRFEAEWNRVSLKDGAHTVSGLSVLLDAEGNVVKEGFINSSDGMRSMPEIQ